MNMRSNMDAMSKVPENEYEIYQSAKQTIAYSHLVSRFPAHIAPLWVASATSENYLRELECQRL